MKRLVILVLFGIAGYIAWHRWPEMFQHQPHHLLEVRNTGSLPIVLLRATVGGQTFVKDSLAPGASTTWKFITRDDSDFELVWEWSGRIGEQHWRGGRVAHGPLVGHHQLAIDGDGGVVYTEQPGSAGGTEGGS